MTTPMQDPAARLKPLEGKRDPQAALALFDALAPVTVEEMTGSWRGSGIATGHPADGLLEVYGWRGKRFDGPDLAHPLVFEDARGTFSIDPAGIPMPTSYTAPLHHKLTGAAVRPLLRLRSTTKPQARLRMMEYRGVVTATMSYDTVPINDHFRKLDDDTLLGAMDERGADAPFIFLLRRDEADGVRR